MEGFDSTNRFDQVLRDELRDQEIKESWATDKLKLRLDNSNTEKYTPFIT